MKKLKIGFVFDDSLDKTDGVQQYVLTMGRWLTSIGHEVHYLVGQTSRRDIPNVHSLSQNVNVRFNGNRLSVPLLASRRGIKRLLQKDCFDVLHVQVPYSPYMAGRVIDRADKRTAIIGTFHIAPHSRLVHYANKVLGIWTRRTRARFDKILSVSTAAADFARDTFGIDTEVLPNVVVVDDFRQAEPFPIAIACTQIVFLGRLVPRKGCMTLLQAAVLLKDTHGRTDFELVICGKGPLEPELKQFVTENGLSDMVRFTGFVSEEDKARYLKSADIAVFPSTGGESFGIVLLEAMAADHPVVLGADNPGYASVLAPYPDLLFPVADAASLANKLAVFMTDTAARAEAQGWQRQYIEGFDVNTVGAKLLKHYEQLLHRRRDVQ